MLDEELVPADHPGGDVPGPDHHGDGGEALHGPQRGQSRPRVARPRGEARDAGRRSRVVRCEWAHESVQDDHEQRQRDADRALAQRRGGDRSVERDESCARHTAAQHDGEAQQRGHQEERERHVDACDARGADPLEAEHERDGGEPAAADPPDGGAVDVHREYRRDREQSGRHPRRRLRHIAERGRRDEPEPVEERWLRRDLGSVAQRQDEARAACHLLHDERLARLALRVERQVRKARQVEGRGGRDDGDGAREQRGVAIAKHERFRKPERSRTGGAGGCPARRTAGRRPRAASPRAVAA